MAVAAVQANPSRPATNAPSTAPAEYDAARLPGVSRGISGDDRFKLNLRRPFGEKDKSARESGEVAGSSEDERDETDHVIEPKKSALENANLLLSKPRSRLSPSLLSLEIRKRRPQAGRSKEREGENKGLEHHPESESNQPTSLRSPSTPPARIRNPSASGEPADLNLEHSPIRKSSSTAYELNSIAGASLSEAELNAALGTQEYIAQTKINGAYFNFGQHRGAGGKANEFVWLALGSICESFGERGMEKDIGHWDSTLTLMLSYGLCDDLARSLSSSQEDGRLAKRVLSIKDGNSLVEFDFHSGKTCREIPLAHLLSARRVHALSGTDVLWLDPVALDGSALGSGGVGTNRRSRRPSTIQLAFHFDAREIKESASAFGASGGRPVSEIVEDIIFLSQHADLLEALQAGDGMDCESTAESNVSLSALFFVMYVVFF